MNNLQEHRTIFSVSDRNQWPLSSTILTSPPGDIFTTTHWALEPLEGARDRLNACKGQLSQLPLAEWQRHTDFTEISSNIRRVIGQRMASAPPPILTRAWIKFYEIIQNFDLFNRDNLTAGQVRAFFLAEAPGGFINATNHYVRLNHPGLAFDWLANTLNPYYESVDFGASVLDDRFIQNLPTLDCWVFGSSNRGDILEPDYIADLEAAVCRRYDLTEVDKGVFDFVTGDGAFDCLDCLDRQEEIVFRLIYREVTIALHFLKHSGSMVIKFFTFFSAETLSLLYYIGQCFERVVACKPVASKHGNSEIYVVASRFDRARYLQLRAASIDLAQISSEKFIFKMSLLNEGGFLDRLVQFSESQANQQMEVIDYNLELYNRGLSQRDRDRVIRKKYWVANTWLRACRLQGICLNEQLLVVDRFMKASKKYAYHLMPLLETWQEGARDDDTFVAKLIQVAGRLDLVCHDNQPLEPASSPSGGNAAECISFVHGKPYDRINNSKFACNSLLKSFAIVSRYTQQQQTKDVVHQNNHDQGVERLRCHLQAIFANGKIKPIQPSDFSKLLDKFFLDSYQDKKEDIVHCLDLHNLTACLTSNDSNVCLQLHQQVEELLMRDVLQRGHSLIVRVKCLLSRLSLGLVYLLVRKFEWYSINCLPLFRDNFASLVIVFKNYLGDPKKPFIDTFEGPADQWNEKLLEVLPVQLLITDAQFFSRVVSANCYSIGYTLKLMLEALKQGEISQEQTAEQDS